MSWVEVSRTYCNKLLVMSAHEKFKRTPPSLVIEGKTDPKFISRLSRVSKLNRLNGHIVTLEIYTREYEDDCFSKEEGGAIFYSVPGVEDDPCFRYKSHNEAIQVFEDITNSTVMISIKHDSEFGIDGFFNIEGVPCQS